MKMAMSAGGGSGAENIDKWKERLLLGRFSHAETLKVHSRIAQNI